MNEYINIRDAVDNLTRVFRALYGAFYPRVVIDGVVKKALSEVPTIEAVPARKGRWVQSEWYCVCSECGKRPLSDWDNREHDYSDKKSDFCPNCGADMRGEDDDGKTE